MKKAETTRLTILQKAFELIYAKGYQTTSIDDILATTQVTKSTFYYHFKNKDEMGKAIINEVMKPVFTSNFIDPLQGVENPLEAIYSLMHNLEKGKKSALVRKEVNAKQATLFVMSGYWGIRNFGNWRTVKRYIYQLEFSPSPTWPNSTPSKNRNKI